MIAQIQVRRGTTAEWAAASPVVLEVGEQGYDTTLKRLKVGDGVTEWASLEWDTLRMWPIGAIYMGVSSTSPATLFGGTWSALEGRMLIGADGTYAAGTTGGASTSTFTLDSSAHAQVMSNSTYGIVLNFISTTAWNANRTVTGTEGTNPISNNYNATKVIGTTKSKSIMPPYLSVYMWKRTA